MKIIFSGGGTLGPVTPLLALHEMIAEEYTNASWYWVGTKRGPERELVEAKGIPFRTLSSGKFRRYISFWNVIDIFRVGIGFFQSVHFLWKENPDICISAGGFISVPVHWAAWLLGIPTWVHQQDVRVGLANKLMAPCATVVTTSLKGQVALFSKKKAVWLGNAVRREVFAGTKKEGLKRFALDGTLPVLFVTGGGTGSMRVNQLIVEAVQHLDGICQIIHLTGKERPQELIAPTDRQFSYYHPFVFFTEEMKDAYAVADLVISRGGFGTITEIAALGKPAILIPKPGHQEENVRMLRDADAVMVIDEQTSNGNHLARAIKEFFADAERASAMGKRLQGLLPPAKKSDALDILEKVLRQ
ncbi:MAG: UDP-N-acetylglucosamine--N-acetylmuramyl-(pentapeptide) pyrophosphoryl-undecaprenol N-acetylglucosamine transferase [Candidatus Magasanikbacteria bacterium CG10_big_fil_rev_8_21_14_0_10_43_6]|uniref:UDP-N-acetylglucosamine--N-acetylmuramyl-(pentapeptide) pyrophosphoryl-undecaprenol N-acetylglucosamine transferase n=1 Tax=Candidatus Magasanikbacteria bacterium CG10_big_fil_rev_8_21_14_0_10_43_6 TaxID=1974650 RepID=A0A2M6W083_9BACT|nr:MAG: UDP-N-acetylglucosamine--N-acetylmuramyl-(pentapeptide) pyrophosphoryl-undecaprenol N-acetylglucosamine transferase [Candidatus Magasanikbacteria bacterium CG10_big_fil_rev_8_21_14_0_10_43_6]